MKKIYTLLFMLLIGFSLKAQEVVSSGGKTQAAAEYELSWTVGEAVTATVSDGTNTLTQGFHQSELIITAIGELLNSDLVLKVYPNPTQDFVNIHFSKLIDETSYSYSLFDLNGKLLEQKNITTNDVKLSIARFAEGSYLLKLSGENHQPLQSFKIVKR